jgi:hypothetical protein
MPVIIALLPLLHYRKTVRIIATILPGGFVLVAMSIGLFYLRAAVLTLLAACVGESAKVRDALS